MTPILPTGWTNVALSDLLTVLESGSRPRGGVSGISGGVPSIGAEHLNYDGSFNFSSIKYVPIDFASRMTKGHIKKNDILVVKDGATTGKVAFVDEAFGFDNAVINEHVFICRATKLIEPSYLFRFLMSKKGQSRILNNFKGSAQGGINQSFAQNTEVPLAPLGEQRRIVLRLERLLNRSYDCQRRLAKIPALLKRFRQSILTSACSGRLTADWRNATNVNEAEQRELEYSETGEPVSEIVEVPETWRWVPLQAICDPTRAICYGVIKLGPDNPTGIPCLRTSDIKSLRIDASSVKCISPEISNQYERTLLRGGEVLVNVRGTLGGVAVVPPELRGWNISREVALVPIRGVSSEYVAYWIASIPCQNWLIGVAKGAAYTGINIGDLRIMPLTMPPAGERQEIVRRVETLFMVAGQIEESLIRAKGYIESLKPSILDKAFRGDLVPQDPSDEPADRLLERIRESAIQVGPNLGRRSRLKRTRNTN